MDTTRALGLIELIPATARRDGVADPFDPAQPTQDARGAVSYVRHPLGSFGRNCSTILCEVTAPYGDPSSEPHPSVPGLALNGSDRKFSRTGPTETGLHPIYRYVDSTGVVHFDL